MKPRKLFYIIVSVTLGLIYAVFGLNFFFPFLGEPPNHTATFTALIGSLVQTNLMAVVKVLEIVGGVLLIIQRYHVLALTLLTPVTVIIVFVHLFADPLGIPIALALVALNVALIAARWNTFKAVLQQR
jgi:putative oxidoreductase